jgi:hypothetical protein
VPGVFALSLLPVPIEVISTAKVGGTQLPRDGPKASMRANPLAQPPAPCSADLWSSSSTPACAKRKISALQHLWQPSVIEQTCDQPFPIGRV